MAVDDWQNEEENNNQTVQSAYSFGHIVSEIENIFGRQSTHYLAKLANDALLEIGAKRQHSTFSKPNDLVQNQRWYPLPTQLIDIIRVEIQDTNGRDVMIPKLSDPHKLLKGDNE